MDPLDIGPGPQWHSVQRLFKVIFGAFAAGFAASAIPAWDGRGFVLASAAVFAAIGFGVPWLRQRWEPHVRLTADGLEGPGLPGEIAWRDIRGARGRVIAAEGEAPEHSYVLLDVPDADPYVGRMSAGQRAMLLAYRFYKLPPLSLQATNLAMTADEIAALVRTRAAYRKPASAPGRHRPSDRG